uniref:Uncharacterized protein n=1 Tax=Glossina austeni TaxID=7395 RepID=A0A1A9UD58_GLOAU
MAVVNKKSCKVDGLIISNTTVSRQDLKDSQLALENGGLSVMLLAESILTIERVQVLTETTQQAKHSTNFKSNYPRSIRATLPRNAIPFITFAHASAGIVGTSATPSIRRENAAPKSLAGRSRTNLL